MIGSKLERAEFLRLNPQLHPTAGSTLTRLVLTFVPVLACLGSLTALFDGVGSGFRVAAVLLLVAALLQRRGGWAATGIVAIVATLAYVWFAAVLFLLLLRGPNEYAWSEIASVTTGLALLVGIALLKDVPRALASLTEGWVIAYLVTAVFAARELIWGEVLPNYYLLDKVDPIGSGWGIASTFGNPNAYAVFLVGSIPILFLGLVKSRSRWMKTGCASSLLIMPVLLSGTNSRTGIVLAALIGTIFLIYLSRIRSTLVLGLSASLVVLGTGALALITVSDSILRGYGGVLHTIDSVFSGIFLESSVVVRWILVGKGLRFAEETAFLGLGPGGFEQRMNLDGNQLDTMGIINPHNGFIEILSEYGILVFLLVVVLLLVIVIAGFQAMSAQRCRGRRTEGLVTVMLVLALPSLATMNSSFLEPPLTWLLLATMLALGLTSKYEGQASAETDADEKIGAEAFRGR